MCSIMNHKVTGMLEFFSTGGTLKRSYKKKIILFLVFLIEFSRTYVHQYEHSYVSLYLWDEQMIYHRFYKRMDVRLRNKD